MTSLADPSSGRPVFYIITTGETQPEGPHPDESFLFDHNDKSFYTWNATTALWERDGTLVP